MKSLGILASTLALLVLGGCLLWLTQANPDGEALVSTSLGQSGSTTKQSRLVGADSLVIRSSAASDDKEARLLTILVVNTEHGVLSDVCICPVARWARTISRSAEMEAVRTNAMGLAQIRFLSGTETVLGLRAAGYQSKVVDWPADPSTQLVVQLERAECLELSVHDPLGTPLPEVTVMLARQEIARAAITAGHDDESLPGFDPDCSMHSARTNAAGEASVGDLQRGKYLIGVHSEYYEVLERELLVVELPGPRLEIVMVPLTGAVLQVTGDELFNYNFDGDAGLVIETPHSYSTDAARRRLKERFPDGLVFLGAAKSVNEPLSTMKLNLLLVGHGRTEIALPMRPLTEDIQPFVLDFSKDTGPRTQGASVTFKMRNPSGTLISCEGFHLVPGALGFSFSKQIQPSVPMRVPYGAYRLKVLRDPLKQRFENKEILISAPEQVVEIGLLHEFVPVELAIHVPPGTLSETVGVQWICDPDHRARVQGGGVRLSNSKPSFQLPAGTVSLRVNAYQCEPWEQRFELLPTKQDEVQVVEVVLKRAL